MLNSLKRSFFKPKVDAKPVTMTVSEHPEEDELVPQAAKPVDCEVTEFDDERGWNEWEDSVFVQDFEMQVEDTKPMPLNPED